MFYDKHETKGFNLCCFFPFFSLHVTCRRNLVGKNRDLANAVWKTLESVNWMVFLSLFWVTFRVRRDAVYYL